MDKMTQPTNTFAKLLLKMMSFPPTPSSSFNTNMFMSGRKNVSDTTHITQTIFHSYYDSEL